MYKHHYNYARNEYGDKAELLFTDTESLTYETETENVYEDFCKDKGFLNFSKYAKESKCYDETNNYFIK